MPVPSTEVRIVDEQGLIHIVDREKDMILVSGFNVYPNQIDDAVALHGKVLEVAAISQTHDVSRSCKDVCG